MATAKKDILVRVSALAFLSSPLWCGSARAQNLQLNCTRNIDIGNLVASGCTDKYIISPDGAHVNPGCLKISQAAVAGSCTLKVTGGVATKSAVITFNNPQFAMQNTKTFTSAKMTSLRMKLRSDTVIASKLTLGVTTLTSPTITIDIGGTLNYSNMQAAGTYSGKVAIKANFN